MRKQPNILLIITDHQAWYGHYFRGLYTYHLPVFERFISEGVFFSRAYSVCPICTATRASIMTGMYPSTHGLRWNTENKFLENRQEFKKNQKIYSHYLEEAGYANAYIGKWHCGENLLPEDYRIPGWSLPGYGNVYDSAKYNDYCAENRYPEAKAYIEHDHHHPELEGTTISLRDPSTFKYSGCSGILEGPPEVHEENFVANLAVNKLQELAKDDKPFCLTASFWGPHQPYLPSKAFCGQINPNDIPQYPSFQDDLEGKPLKHFIHRDLIHRSAHKWKDWSIWQQILARCYEQSIQLDAAIGTVLDAVENLGLSNNTLIIWCADHGDAVASHGGVWDKDCTYTEEVARIPFAVKWPGKIPAGINIDQLVSNLDVTATMLDAVGVTDIDHLHSRSLLPLCVNNQQNTWPDRLVCEHNGHAYNNLQRVILHDKYKYVLSLYEQDELYDLEEDPWEMHNIAQEKSSQSVITMLIKKLTQHIKETDDHLGLELLQSLS
jgi:arylsulfatase A-like enzyme